MFFDVIKANKEIGNLRQSILELTSDRDAQLAKLAEFELKNKDYIESAQTYEQVKADYESKLADKDTEIAALKEATIKQVAEVKATVADETITILASQGTSVPIDTSSVVLSNETALAQLKQLSGGEARLFYFQNKSLIDNALYNKKETI